MTLKKHGGTILTALFVCVLSFLVICSKLTPEQSMLGYRLYVVLTNSMEPVIPTYSLVLVRDVDDVSVLQENDIVTFRAARFGSPILLTHYLRRIEISDNGTTYYRTQGAEAPNLDGYDTTSEDIVGTYAGHIPVIGKLILFSQSKFGFMLLMEFLVIWLIHRTIVVKWEEAEQRIWIKQVSMKEEQGMLMISGMVENQLPHPIHFVLAKLTLYDSQKQILKCDPWFLIDEAVIQPNNQKSFTYQSEFGNQVAHIEIEIQRYKCAK